MSAGTTARAVLRPLVSGVTYRRGVHLLLGGVLLLPYVLLGTAFAQMFGSETPPALTLLLLLVTAVIAVAPAFLRATRTLEAAAARALLGVDLPEPAAGNPAGTAEARLRSALWFATHLVTGGAVAVAMLALLPLALAFLAAQLGIGAEVLAGFRLGPLDQDDTVWLSLLGLGLLLLLAYAVAGLGALAAIMAPVLLGPSPAERIAALEAEAGELAQRNRLARELHDSIGHALTVTTLQAAAAREVLDADPEFARRALAAVEETGRTAMAELDHVLGLLRESAEPPGRTEATGRAPGRTLSDLDRLIADARATGAEMTVEIGGGGPDAATKTLGSALADNLARVPTVVSREGYRIIQEGLTNAARHARGAPVSLRLVAAGDTLTIEITNPVGAATGEHSDPVPGTREEVAGTRDEVAGTRDEVAGRGGRGLAGMRERVARLGGDLVAGPAPGPPPEPARWRVSARLPLGRGPRRTP